MKRIFISMSFVVLLVPLVATAAQAVGEGRAAGRRYFYSGDGNISLVNAKNGASFQGRYRLDGDRYDPSAVEMIQRTFEAESSEPLSAISLRLIEFFDYLEDRLAPGATITIVSGWRSPEYNDSLRSQGRLAAKASLHQYGMAADIKMDGVASEQLWNYVKQLGFGGAGYYHGQLVHLDVGPARSWDETTSGVGTDISEHNKLIGLVTDFDIYRPGERISFRFIRMTAFPIGVMPQFSLERVEEGGKSKRVAVFGPSFGTDAAGDCPQFAGIGEMTGITWQLPGNLPPGRYQVRALFCERPWDDMPADTVTPSFEVVRPEGRGQKG